MGRETTLTSWTINTNRIRSREPERCVKRKPKSEGLMWSILRAKQLCGLKFRRQHPIGPWITDFACPAEMLVVEIDGGYHEASYEHDIRRQQHLHKLGWTVLRFTDENIEEDAESVGRAIASALSLPYEFRKREATGAGMKSTKAAKSKPTKGGRVKRRHSTLPWEESDV